MLIEYKGRRPTVDESAYVAPNAVIRGDVRIGPGSAVLFGAVVAVGVRVWRNNAKRNHSAGAEKAVTKREKRSIIVR